MEKVCIYMQVACDALDENNRIYMGIVIIYVFLGELVQVMFI
jgi:hypothetical protein